MSLPNLLDNSLAPQLALHRFSVEQYHQMGKLGVLTPDDRVELLEGLIVAKMNQRPIHGFIVGLLNEWFQQKLPPGWIVRCQLPITTARSEPEPDLVILKGAHADFRYQHPAGKNCRLVIEVADTSLEKDRAKTTIYHDAGVQEYWIINVQGKLLERYDFSVMRSGKSLSIEPQFISPTATVNLAIDASQLSFELTSIFE